jgi:hypothetical protein
MSNLRLRATIKKITRFLRISLRDLEAEILRERWRIEHSQVKSPVHLWASAGY